MICRYKQKMIYAGDRQELFIYPEFAKSQSGIRRGKWRKTPAVQERLNERNAIRKLSRLVNCNFGLDDYMISLEYREEDRPENIDCVKADVRNYMRRVKNFYRKNGFDPPKYIIVFEEGGKRKNLHLHVFLSGGADRNELEKLWARGFANAKRLQPQHFDGLDRIASYVQKAPCGSRRWIPSRNLAKPIEPPPRTISKREALRILATLDDRDKTAAAFGSRVLHREEILNDVNGGIYAAIDLIALNQNKAGGKKRKCKKE